MSTITSAKKPTTLENAVLYEIVTTSRTSTISSSPQAETTFQDVLSAVLIGTVLGYIIHFTTYLITAATLHLWSDFFINTVQTDRGMQVVSWSWALGWSLIETFLVVKLVTPRNAKNNDDDDDDDHDSLEVFSSPVMCGKHLGVWLGILAAYTMKESAWDMGIQVGTILYAFLILGSVAGFCCIACTNSSSNQASSSRTVQNTDAAQALLGTSQEMDEDDGSSSTPFSTHKIFACIRSGLFVGFMVHFSTILFNYFMYSMWGEALLSNTTTEQASFILFWVYAPLMTVAGTVATALSLPETFVTPSTECDFVTFAEQCSSCAGVCMGFGLAWAVRCTAMGMPLYTLGAIYVLAVQCFSRGEEPRKQENSEPVAHDYIHII